MASVAFRTAAPAAVASPAAGRSQLPGIRGAARPSTAHIVVPAATKVVAAKAAEQQEKGLFDAIFGALYKEEQLLETDPILNKVEGKAPAAAASAPKKSSAAAADADTGGGFSFGGLFSKKG